MDIQNLCDDISKCTLCAPHLQLGPRPIVSFSSTSKIMIIGQAPGTKVHYSGIPWNDQSGKNLRNWMGVTDDVFYDPDQIGIVPMGFCYPGKGKSGDLPPRKECAPHWHSTIFNYTNEVRLTLLIGQYAQAYYLKNEKEKTLTATVANFGTYLPKYFVLPHPSPRNNIWMAKNPWFQLDIIPALKLAVKNALQS